MEKALARNEAVKGKIDALKVINQHLIAIDGIWFITITIRLFYK